ncbi:alanine racemase [Microbacterium tenebrionis]|uniref:alanine racemase n=1 Tax=Microbacterium tenebrionis TaxID=2830665 RepID=UPI00158B9FB5|nr:alanine racemase [Microbacterium ihumii]
MTTLTDTPVLVLDERRMQRNIDEMAAAVAAAGVSLRPHFKTSKMIEVARRQLAAGAVGMTCATLAEAGALLDAGITDLFWANAPATAHKAAAVVAANRRGRVIVGVDSLALGENLSAAARAEGAVVEVRLEVDTGLHRTGVAPEAAVELALSLAAFPGIALEGVYMHEGQLASIRGDRAEVKAAGRSASHMLVETADAIRAAGLPLSSVSVGSTPGWDSAPFVPGVTEARAGTYVFFDANQWRLGSAPLERTALQLHSTVVSGPRDGEVVIDAGIKALSSDGSNRDATFGIVVDESRTPQRIVFDRAYEEHGILRGPDATTHAVGDRVRIVPNHACGIVNMWSRVVVVDGDRVVEEWHPVGRY